MLNDKKETLAQILEKLGVVKVKSYPCTPEHKPQDKPQPQQPESMKL